MTITPAEVKTAVKTDLADRADEEGREGNVVIFGLKKEANENVNQKIIEIFAELGAIHKRRPLQRGRGVWQKRTLLLIFACKRPKYADTGDRWRGSKIGQILQKSFMDGPL